MQNDNFQKEYLNIIQEQFHRNPVFGWNKDYFQKIMIKMLMHSIKKLGAKSFDNYFLSDKLFSFKNLFDSDPQVNVAGAGKNLSITLKYVQEKGFNSEKILVGEVEGAEKKGLFSGLLKKLKLSNDKKGLLWNNAFLEEFQRHGKFSDGIEGNRQGGDDEETIPQSSVKINSSRVIILEAQNGLEKPFNQQDIENNKIEQIGVIFQFNKIKYCQNSKKLKDFVNANRVDSMTGSASLYFKTVSDQFTVEVATAPGITWTQERTQNMNPPKPIRDQIKQIWNNPNEGFGLLGLGLKKLGGGVKNTLLGPIGSAKIAQESLDCDFQEIYSANNMKGITAQQKTKKDNQKLAAFLGQIQNMLGKGNEGIIWDVRKEGKQYICQGDYEADTILTIKFTLQ